MVSDILPPNFLHDRKIRERYPVIAGIDEAGRGPLAGPVVAACVVLPEGVIIEGLRDSKQILPKVRKEIFWEIVQKASHIGIGISDPELIDRVNILRATKQAMVEAINNLGTRPDALLIDAIRLDGIDIPQIPIIKGDSVSASIAAASVVAKVIRDDIMEDYHERYPVYNFKSHKGYPTRKHRELIRRYGPSPVHRMSFKGVGDGQTEIEWGGDLN